MGCGTQAMRTSADQVECLSCVGEEAAGEGHAGGEVLDPPVAGLAFEDHLAGEAVLAEQR